MKSRSRAPGGKTIIHLCGYMRKSHRLHVRPGHAAETLAAARNMDECYPAAVASHEMWHGPLGPAQPEDIREGKRMRGLRLQVSPAVHAETADKSLSSKELKIPTGRTFLGQISWIRERLGAGHRAQRAVARRARRGR